MKFAVAILLTFSLGPCLAASDLSSFNGKWIVPKEFHEKAIQKAKNSSDSKANLYQVNIFLYATCSVKAEDDSVIVRFNIQGELGIRDEFLGYKDGFYHFTADGQGGSNKNNSFKVKFTSNDKLKIYMTDPIHKETGSYTIEFDLQRKVEQVERQRF